VGELAFLNFGLDRESDSEQREPSLASADAVVGDGGASVWEWEFRKLSSFLENEREVANALSAYINHDLREKLISTGILSMPDLDIRMTRDSQSPATEEEVF
jgi:hypothetical protein